MNRRLTPALAGLFLLAAGPAFAHPGHFGGDGLAAGLEHPLGGLDHLLAMTAVGLWAGLAGRRALWIWPAAFVGFMLAGFALGRSGMDFPLAEAGIAASLLGLGLAIGLELRPPAALGAGAIALFALAHGFAHGREIPGGADAARFALGFGLSTAALHATGIGLAFLALRLKARPFARFGGLGIAAVGALMLLTP